MSPTKSPDLVPIKNPDGTPMALTEMEAIELQSLLEVNEIEAAIDSVEMMPNLPARLLVPSSVLDRAMEIITEARETGTTGAEEAEMAGEEDSAFGAGGAT